jgi:hypothetical protein
LTVWLLESSGAQDALIGDLLEEMDRGRSRWWIGEQVIGLCGCALVEYAKQHARVTPLFVVVALVALFLGGLSIAPPSLVLQAWAVTYFVTGTLSLFGHLMALSTFDSRTLVTPVSSDPGK